MQSHYKTLGLTNAASSAEIRRAYRVLARRYHPDVNPDGDNDEIFKAIALAYSVLSDPEKRKQHDIDLKQSGESIQEAFERARETLRRNQSAAAYAEQQAPTQRTDNSTTQATRSQRATAKPHAQEQRKKTTPRPSSTKPMKDHRSDISFAAGKTVLKASRAIKELAASPVRAVQGIKKALSYARSKVRLHAIPTLKQLSVVEVSVSISDAIRGTRRTIEIAESSIERRKVSISIPPGVLTGGIIRLRSKEQTDSEIVAIIKVESHPWLSISERGLTMEIPLTISEAIEGAKIQVPTLGDPVLLTVEPLTQSGREVRLKGQGVFNRDGTRGDLFIRFQVKIPEKPLPCEFQSLSELLSELYPNPVRGHLPNRLLEE
jgi:molecular chaperone DnaJ